MDKISILVIDDEYEISDSAPRKDTYLTLEKHKLDGRFISIEFATSPSDAETKINNGHYHLALIDIVLEQWGDHDGAVFEALVKSASIVMPVGLVSSHWDVSSVPQIRKVLLSDVSIDIRLLFKWHELELEDTRQVVALQLQKEILRHSKQNILGLSSKESIKILHISDLHFSTNKTTLAGAELKRVTDKIFKEWKSGPDLIFVSGDITNTGHPDEYLEAVQWFKSLSHQLGFSLPTNKIFIVPGNHDFSVPISQSQRVIFKEAELSEPNSNGLVQYAVAPYVDFKRKISEQSENSDYNGSGCWVDSRYRHQGIVISGFSTSRLADSKGWPARQIHIDEISSIEDKIKYINESENSPLFHIMLSHHSPVKSEATQPILNTDELITHLIDTPAAPQLALHGHEHARETHIYNGKLLVVTAPTPSSREENRPRDTARGFNMIELKRKDFQVTGIKSWSYILEARKWEKINVEEYTFNKRDKHWRKKQST